MAKSGVTSRKMAATAAKIIKDPKKATRKQIKSLAASALSQAPNRRKKPRGRAS